MAPLFPAEHPAPRRWLERLIDTAHRADEAWSRHWRAFLSHHKGELTGQRGIDAEAFVEALGLPPLEPPVTLFDCVLGTYAYLVSTAHTLALRTLQTNPEPRLRALLSNDDASLAEYLADVTSGRIFEDELSYPESPMALAPLVARAARRAPDCARRWRHHLAEASSARRRLLARRNPFGDLHAELVPSALLHPTGEHDTPVWLAEQLIRDAGWHGESRLLDPFGGSGSVLLAAIAEARRQDRDPLEALRSCCMIELNPAVAALAKANLIVALAPAWREADDSRSLPVLCADTLSPALAEATGAQGRLWSSSSPRRHVAGREVEQRPRLDCEALRALDQQDSLPLPPDWLEPADEGKAIPSTLQQALVAHLAPADHLVTNPPWVGWEYVPEAYRESTEPLWTHHELFTSTGREAAFLKEDLSTLALTVAVERLLRDGGRASTVLRRATMTSRVAAGGLRRLRLEPSGEPLDLECIRLFESIELFGEATTDSATWTLEKGTSSTFPIETIEWSRASAKPLSPDVSLQKVHDAIETRSLHTRRRHPGDVEGPWAIGAADSLRAARKLRGTTRYRARTGVFTGGANAVYYLEPLTSEALLENDEDASWYRNRIERGRRRAPEMCVRLENELVREVIGGSDLERWRVSGESHLLCPHSEHSGMSPIDPETFASRYPRAHRYFEYMRPVLAERQGFSGWEGGLQQEGFYTLLRIGPYTFEPYKVAWRYIANDFIVSVVAPSDDGNPRLPNDKLAYVGLSNRQEAYYLCGLLSSSPLRWQVVASTTSTQISAGVLERLAIPTFDADDERHRRVAELCRRGHESRREEDNSDIREAIAAIDEIVADLYDFEAAEMEAFQREISSM